MEVEYTKGGVPVILVPSEVLAGSGICGNVLTKVNTSGTNGGDSSSGSLEASIPFLFQCTFVTLAMTFLVVSLCPFIIFGISAI